MSFNKRIGKETIVSPYSGILFSKKMNELLINLAIWIKLKGIMQVNRQIPPIMRRKINQAIEIDTDDTDEKIDKHINTVLIGIPHVQEVKGKTEQVCLPFIKVSTPLKTKATIFEMTHTLDRIDGRRFVNLKTQHRRKD